MNKDKIIDFKEFLLCLSFSFFVDAYTPSDHSEEFEALHAGFKLCAQAFAFFDKDGGGTIDKNEVRPRSLWSFQYTFMCCITWCENS